MRKVLLEEDAEAEVSVVAAVGVLEEAGALSEKRVLGR